MIWVTAGWLLQVELTKYLRSAGKSLEEERSPGEGSPQWVAQAVLPCLPAAEPAPRHATAVTTSRHTINNPSGRGGGGGGERGGASHNGWMEGGSGAV